jgi:hypothetical protein
LRDAAKHWLGLTHGEILAAIEADFAEHRPRYTSGSGDGLFWMAEAAIRKAWQAKQARDHVDEDLERPGRRRAGGVRRQA